jgi:alkyldihydroxyacetonephosphate synthase
MLRVDALSSQQARLPDGVVSTHPGELLSRSRDSWPLAMLREARGDRMPRPMAVVFPSGTEDVSETLRWAQETGTPVVPRGGGSGVCGGAQAVWRGVVLDLSRMDRVVEIDRESQAVTVEAGTRGDRVEASLNDEGLTLGHYPQSLSITTVGGWIAARSAGHASAGFGVIEDLLLGFTGVLPTGEVIRSRSVPRSAAGPDLSGLFVGSEGTMGVITEASLSAARITEGLRWLVFRPPDFPAGLDIARDITQSEIRPTVLRVYDEADAAITFPGLQSGGGPALLMGLAKGPELRAATQGVREAARGRGAEALPDTYGTHWWEHRFDAVELHRRIMGEERMLGPGVLVDTLEVAALWFRLAELYEAVRKALSDRAAQAVGCHLSHPYRSGGSLYFTFLLRSEDDRKAERAYLECWRAAVEACHAAGGTLTHHHGVGILKSPFTEAELGPGGFGLLRTLKRTLDPAGVLNPGKLLPLERSDR